MAERDEDLPPGEMADALTRLRTRLSDMQIKVLDLFAALGPDSNPLIDLQRLSAYCQDRPLDGIVMPDGQEGMPGPATIAILAERLGFEVFWENPSIKNLETTDLPAVILLRNATSRLVITRPDRESFEVLGPEGPYFVPVDALVEAATGTMFRVTPSQSAQRASEPVFTAPAAALPPSTNAPAALAEESRENKGVLPFLKQALSGQGMRIFHLCIASLLINVLGMALPLFSMAVFDRVIPHAAIDTLAALAIGVSVALLFELMLRSARLKLFDAVGLSASFSLQGRLIGRLLFGRADAMPRVAGGLLPATQELESMSHVVPQLLVSLAVDVPFFILIMVFIASIGGPVVLAPLIGTLVMIGAHVLAHLMARRSQMQLVAQVRRQVQTLIESIAGIDRIRATGAARRFLSGWERGADDAGYSAFRNRYWHGLSAQFSAVLVQSVIVATIVIGVFRIQDAAMSIGALSAATLLINRALMPISALTGLIFRVMQGLESTAQIAPLLQTEAEAGGDRQLHAVTDIRPQIDFHQVSFQYPGESRMALREVSLSIKPGERIGIIGKAGCGKTSLLKMIARLHDPVSGRLQLDGRDIRQFDPADIRRLIAYMPQETQLFDLSLYDNLTIGLPHVPQERFEAITKLAGVHDFVSTHPSGYSLAVGPGGQRLSGGERQAVSLARALMGEPRMLILDEPTSAMDNGLEARIIRDFKTELGETGLLIATHRLPLLALVDRVIWLDGGRIVADGPKAQVFAKIGIAA